MGAAFTFGGAGPYHGLYLHRFLSYAGPVQTGIREWFGFATCPSIGFTHNSVGQYHGYGALSLCRVLPVAVHFSTSRYAC